MRERSLELVRKYIEAVWNRGDAIALEQLTTADFEYVLGGNPSRDRSTMRAFIEQVRTAFPDWQVTIRDAASDGETVAVRWEGLVTHAGPFYGIPPTGRQVAVSGINMYRVSGDRISREWEQMDSLGLLRQLGAESGRTGQSSADT